MKNVQKNIIKNQNLSRFHSYKMSVIAKYFYVLNNIEELKPLLQYFHKEYPNLPIELIGEGTNISFSNKLFRGLIIINRAKRIRVGKRYITIDSGVKLRTAIQQLRQKGIEGIRHLEFIPGSVGGGVIGNVSRGPRSFVSFGDIVHSVRYLGPNLEEKTVRRKDLQLNEKYSYFKKKKDYYLLDINFKYPQMYPRKEKFNIEKYVQKREYYSSIGKTCGCYFNPVIRQRKDCSFLSEQQKEIFSADDGNISIPAGLLIDMAGCKNMKFGKAYVSGKHASFLVNAGDAVPEELLKLAQKVKSKVMKKFGVELTEEVNIF